VSSILLESLYEGLTAWWLAQFFQTNARLDTAAKGELVPRNVATLLDAPKVPRREMPDVGSKDAAAIGGKNG
jgi:hypothetical protein